MWRASKATRRAREGAPVRKLDESGARAGQQTVIARSDRRECGCSAVPVVCISGDTQFPTYFGELIVLQGFSTPVRASSAWEYSVEDRGLRKLLEGNDATSRHRRQFDPHMKAPIAPRVQVNGSVINIIKPQQGVQSSTLTMTSKQVTDKLVVKMGLCQVAALNKKLTLNLSRYFVKTVYT